MIQTTSFTNIYKEIQKIFALMRSMLTLEILKIRLALVPEDSLPESNLALFPPISFSTRYYETIYHLH